jgi:ribosome biogenesis GTPase
VTLEKLGWNSYFNGEFSRLSEPASEAARIAAVDRDRFVVWAQSGECAATVSGRLRHLSEQWPEVGDWVALESGCRIARILPRQTAFSRKEPGSTAREQGIAANVDVLFVVSGLDGDFNRRRIERYLLLAWESGAKPVVVLNKADMCIDVAEASRGVSKLAFGAPVLVVSALEAWDLPALEAHLQPGLTAALAGSSGAGKSTLANRLLGREQQRVQDLRADDSRGRHTTVRRELFLAPAGWLLIDTPGLRELQLWAVADSVDAAFFPTSPRSQPTPAFATAAIKASPAARLPRPKSTTPAWPTTPRCNAHWLTSTASLINAPPRIKRAVSSARTAPCAAKIELEAALHDRRANRLSPHRNHGE